MLNCKTQHTYGNVQSYVYSLLGSIDLTVTEVLGMDEARQTILKTGTHPNTLAWTTPIIKMLPYLTTGTMYC